jgi:hypothetical protein
MLRKTLVEMGLFLFVALTLGGMLYFISAALIEAPLFDNLPPDAMRYP